MGNKNEYYFLEASRINLVTHTDVVGNADSVRWSLDKSEFVIKTKEGIKNSGALTPYVPYTQSEALTYINKPANGYIEVE